MIADAYRDIPGKPMGITKSHVKVSISSAGHSESKLISAADFIGNTAIIPVGCIGVQQYIDTGSSQQIFVQEINCIESRDLHRQHRCNSFLCLVLKKILVISAVKIRTL